MVRIMRSLFCLMLAACLIVLGAAPVLAENIPVWINNSSATIQAASGETGSLPAGTGVYMTAVRDGWAQISYNGNIGYIHTKYLTLVEGITGYVVQSVPVYQYATTSSAKYGPLDVGTELKLVGMDGDFYQVTNGIGYGYIQKSALSPNKPSDIAILASKVQLVDWDMGNAVMKRGNYVQFYDIMSGLTFYARRAGGTLHADFEPVTTEDTAKILQMGDGKFSWDSRPVIVNTGYAYFVGAINTMPHDGQTISDNNFDGVFCLHLPGSKTHGTNKENANHQLAIKYAYAWISSKK